MFNDIRKTLLRGLGVLVFIGILVFAYFRYSAYIYGPEITSINIDQFMSVDEPSLTLSADIKNTQSVIINGRNTTLKEKSHFDEIITFSPGVNILEIILKDTFNREKLFRYSIHYTEQETKNYPQTLTEAKNQQELTEDALLETN